MLYHEIDRNELIDLGSRAFNATSAERISAPKETRCILVWDSDIYVFPAAIIVPAGGVESFYAWAATFLPHLVPISAISRIVSYDEWVERQKGARVVSALTSIENGMIGLIHAEATGR